MGVLRDVWANYRDESFICQFLIPRLMRHFRMFHLHDDPAETAGIRVDAIHDERGYRRVRRALSRQYDVGLIDANIQVVDVDLAGDRRLILHHTVLNGALLDETDAKRVLQHLADLWSYDVSLVESRRDRQGAEGIRRQPARAGRGGVATLPAFLAIPSDQRPRVGNFGSLCGSNVGMRLARRRGARLLVVNERSLQQQAWKLFRRSGVGRYLAGARSLQLELELLIIAKYSWQPAGVFSCDDDRGELVAVDFA